MGINIELITYSKEEIENYIKKYPKTKIVFEKCGKFLGDKHLLLNNELVEANSPYYQLDLGFKMIIAYEKGIDWKNNENILWDIEDEMLDEFEKIKHNYDFLPNYIDFIEEYYSGEFLTKEIKEKLCAKYKNSLLAVEDEFSQITKKMK